MSKDILVARLGRSKGLFGQLRLIILGDFPQIFKVGASFHDAKGLELKIKEISGDLVVFLGHESLEAAKLLVNKELFCSEDFTRAACKLEENEHFYFDVIGLELYENDLLLGTVFDIYEVNASHLLEIKTAQSLIEQGLSKRFYLPYIDRYVEKIEGKVYAKDALELLKAS